jgi:hypothetical protein
LRTDMNGWSAVDDSTTRIGWRSGIGENGAIVEYESALRIG